MKYVPMTDKKLHELHDNSGGGRDGRRAIEQAVLARIEAQGLVIVPREPSLDMITAFWGEVTRGDAELNYAKECYKAMLEAAKEST